jgi:hypothetical protein
VEKGTFFNHTVPLKEASFADSNYWLGRPHNWNVPGCRFLTFAKEKQITEEYIQLAPLYKSLGNKY